MPTLQHYLWIMFLKSSSGMNCVKNVLYDNGRPQAVSYTHLDVYKRQVHKAAAQLNILFGPNMTDQHSS